MQLALQSVSSTFPVLCIIPFPVDMDQPEFAAQYEQGLIWSLEANREPFVDNYLVDVLKLHARQGFFDGQHDPWLNHLGFFFGMIYGAILSPQNGQIRPGVTTLVILKHELIARGYRIGREYYFHEEGGKEPFTATRLLGRLQESVHKFLEWKDTDATWDYTIGCILGELSGPLFPETVDESQQWEEDNRR